MKNKTTQTKSCPFSWIHKHRLKIVAFAFFFVIPVSFILTAYIGSFIENRRVTFDSEITEESEFITNFKNINSIDAFDLVITWNDLKHPVSSNDETLSGGFYRFQIHYEINENFDVKAVQVTPVLQTNWISYRSPGVPIVLREDPRAMIISFNYLLPNNPLLFVEVTEPYLYLKVQYVLVVADTEQEHTEYIRFSLSGLNPLNVIP